MDCKEIVVNLRHDVRGERRFDSFFVIDAKPDEPLVAEILGECYVDRESMTLYSEWLQGTLESCTLLVSLGYKYAQVVLGRADEYMKNNHFLVFSPRSLPMLPNPVSGPPKEKLIPALRRELTGYPADQIKYGLRLKGKANQLDSLLIPTDFMEFDPLAFVDVANITEARDVSLVWRLICTDSPEAARPGWVKELEHRIENGWLHGESWFNATPATLDDIHKRRARAQANFENILDIVAQLNPSHVSIEPDSVKKTTESVRTYLRSITDLDEIHELYVFAGFALRAPSLWNLNDFDGSVSLKLSRDFGWTARADFDYVLRSGCFIIPSPTPFVSNWENLSPLLWEQICRVMAQKLRQKARAEIIHAPVSGYVEDEFQF